jgi:hypothetical protein
MLLTMRNINGTTHLCFISKRRVSHQIRGQTMTVAVDRGILARSSLAGRCSPGFVYVCACSVLDARAFNLSLLLIYFHPSPTSMRGPRLSR